MRKLGILFSVVLTACLLLGNSTEAKTSDSAIDQMEVHFIDVGQGDATLVKCGDAAMLIDAGENDKGTFIQNYLKKQGVKSLDYLIMTHPDADHSGGADVIITKYDIDTIITPNYDKDTKTWRDVLKAMDNRRYKVTKPVVGDTYRLGDAKFTIIAPNTAYEDANNNSVAILLQHGEKKFVFTGDAEEESEQDIISNKINLSADVLKVGHHGSKTASSPAFIKKVAPQYAVISCAENNEYGHPHAATLNTLRSNKVKLYRTDEQGSLIAASNGTTITWNAAPTETWKSGEPKSEVVASPAVEEPKQEAAQDNSSLTYILNKKSKKFHNASCSSLPTTNRMDTALSRDEVVAQGYSPCGRCNP